VRQARAQQALARSALMPNVVGYVNDTEQKINLAALGVRFDVPVPGFALPDTVGPFNVVDLRARLSQTVVDLTARNNYRAAQETVRGSELASRDSRDVIALAVGGAYLQALAARARVQSIKAQIETATALFQRTSQQRAAGLATPIDANRAQVQVLAQQQRLTSLQVDFAKQKINLARMIGLPPTDQYDLDADVPFTPALGLSVAEAMKQATEQRSDLKAAESQVHAAELALAAAQAVRLPSVMINADYGANRSSPTPARTTYSFTAAVRVPIWEGGRAQGEVERAEAALAQRRAELEDLKAQIEADVRAANLDLEAAASQVEVAQTNRRVNAENLTLTKQRFDAGVNDNVTVVQSQELVAAAELDYINSVFAHNLTKLVLARATGRAADAYADLLKVP
jgi:outer membrane protein TolC